MSRPLRAAVLIVAAVGTLALGGCRGVVAAAPASGTGASADQLGSIESSISAVEKHVDQDGTG